MAANPAGDIAGARYLFQPAVTHASVASNGAAARLGQFGPMGIAWRPIALYWSPTGADQSASQSASYRRLDLYNGGTAGTATATASRAATLAVSASLASLGARAMVVDTTVTFGSTDIAYFSQSTVGGNDANGTVIQAGQFGGLLYEAL